MDHRVYLKEVARNVNANYYTSPKCRFYLPEIIFSEPGQATHHSISG